MKNSKEIGNFFECEAKKYLQKHNYEIICTNYHSRWGEIDIIIKDEDYIVFVEVKYRKNFSYGRPKEYVNINKQNKLIKSAYTYISDNNIKSSQNFRFDVIEIFHKNKEIVIEHIKNAF